MNSELIRSLPESLSVISPVASAQQDMTIESLDSLKRSKSDRTNTPHNPQGQKVTYSITKLPANRGVATYNKRKELY